MQWTVGRKASMMEKTVVGWTKDYIVKRNSYYGG